MTVDAPTVAAIRAEWAADRPVVLPTDTVYGLAVPASSEAGVAAMFSLKRRPIDRRMPVLVADVDQAAEWVESTDNVRLLADRFWPGGLTVVGRRRPAAPPWVGDESTLGVRCPDEALVRSLAAELGPLAATSANLHGEPSPADPAVLTDVFAGLLVVDDGPRAGAASTVVVVTDDGWEIVREGPVTASDISAVLGPRS